MNETEKKLICPHCGAEISPEEFAVLRAKFHGSITTPKKAAASAANGRKGGRPVGSKDRQPRIKKNDQNP